MSKHKKLKKIQECGGEGFEENFFFSSMMSDTSLVIDKDKIQTKLNGFVSLGFIEDYLIKSNFWTTKSKGNGNLNAATTNDQTTPRNKKKWGWSNSKFSSKTFDDGTPIAK